LTTAAAVEMIVKTSNAAGARVQLRIKLALIIALSGRRGIARVVQATCACSMCAQGCLCTLPHIFNVTGSYVIILIIWYVYAIV